MQEADSLQAFAICVNCLEGRQVEWRRLKLPIACIRFEGSVGSFLWKNNARCPGRNCRRDDYSITLDNSSKTGVHTLVYLNLGGGRGVVGDIGAYRIITDDNPLIGGWGNYDHREISFFNQVNTGTLGGKGGPFDQVAYKQKLSQVSRLIFLSLYHLQVFFYRIKRIGHWFKASQLWVQPIEGGLRLWRPIAGGPAAQT